MTQKNAFPSPLLAFTELIELFGFEISAGNIAILWKIITNYLHTFLKILIHFLCEYKTKHKPKSWDSRMSKYLYCVKRESCGHLKSSDLKL